MGRVMVDSFLSAHRGQMPDAAWQQRVDEWTPERRYTTGGTAQGRRCTVNGGNVRPRLAAGVAASGRGPAGRHP